MSFEIIMSSDTRKRRKDYLEPDEEYVLPKQTMHNRRKSDKARNCSPSGSRTRSDSSRTVALTDNTDVEHVDEAASDASGTASAGDDTDDDTDDTGSEDMGSVDDRFDYSSSDDHESDGEAQSESEHPASTSDEEQPRQALSDDEDEESDAAYFRHKYGESTLPHQTTTQAQAILLVLAYIVSAGLSWTQVDGLLKLVNALFGEAVLPNSKFLLRKIWTNANKEMMNYNFFCENCHRLLLVSKKPTQNQQMTCPLCNIVYFSNEMIEKGTFFLIFNLKKQIKNLINIQRTSLLQNLEKIAQKTEQVLSDITDGHLVRLTRKKLGCALHDLTASISTDGSPIFKSSKLSMWPVHIMINELPTITRWQNLLLGGLWFGKGKPDMFLFLNAFVEQFNAIETILWKCFQTGQTLSTKIYMVCCIADAPARAAVMNRKQFNGYYGCPWCYQRGTLVQGVYV